MDHAFVAGTFFHFRPAVTVVPDGKKKKQKDLYSFWLLNGLAPNQTDEAFLVLFLEKRTAFFLLHACATDPAIQA
jgi:hypothetical protein